jgi:hypothetical protein
MIPLFSDAFGGSLRLGFRDGAVLFEVRNAGLVCGEGSDGETVIVSAI